MTTRLKTEKRIRTDDGVELYARETRGTNARGTPLICANGIGVTTFFWRFIEKDFSAERPVICWDYRGHGQSGKPRDLTQLTIRRNARDLLQVLDAFGHDRAVLLGHSMGVQVILETWKVAPKRVSALVPMFGTHGRPVDTFFELPIAAPLAFMFVHRFVTLFPKRLGALQKMVLGRPVLARIAGKLARLTRIVHPELMPQKDLDSYLEHFGDFEPEVFFRMAEKMATHTAEPFLEKIDVPVLVVAGTKDLFTPLWLSEEMADRLPNARLLILKDGSHAAMVEQPKLVDERLRAFLETALPKERAEAATTSGRHRSGRQARESAGG